MKAAGVRPPQVISQYTPEAKAAKIERLVVLQAVINEDGSVGSVEILRGLGYGLDEAAALHTVKSQWRFRPGTKDGKPVKVRMNIEMSFRLS